MQVVSHEPLKKLLTYFRASPWTTWWIGIALFAVESLLLSLGRLRDRKPLLLIHPNHPTQSGRSGKALLMGVLHENRSGLIEAINQHCAVIFRGFGDLEPSDYDEVVEALGFQESKFPGTTPRVKISKYFYVNEAEDFTAGSASLESKPKTRPAHVGFHNENAYFSPDSKHQSTHIAMCCEIEPDYAGWTFLSDAIAVHSLTKMWLPALYKYRLLQRTFGRPGHQISAEHARTSYYDFTEGTGSLTNGYQFGQTPEELTAIGREFGLEIRQPDESTVQLWSQTLPISNLDEESGHRFVFCNSTDVRLRGLVSEDGSSYQRLGYVSYLLNAAYWICSQPVAWREGDIMLFNNRLVAHAGSYFRGKRKIVPAFGRFARD